MRNNWLIAAGLLSAAASVAHFAIIIGGPAWYRFFGAGEEMARAAQQGSVMPGLVTAAIGTTLALWAGYAFSAAGIIPRLPLLRTGLVVITALYMLRALALIPMLVLTPHMVNRFWIISSLIVLCYGLTYAVGMWRAWPGRKRPLITVDGINRNEGLTFGYRSAHPARGVARDLAKAHLVVENGKAARLVHLLR